MSLDVEASLKVAFGTLICAAMVVGIHVCDDVAVHGSLVWWWEQIGHYGLFLAAVPFFFVCSGFFLGRHCDEEGWWSRECLKRVRSLLVPYLVWSTVFAALGIGAVVTANFIHGRDIFLHCPCGWRYWTRVIGVYLFDYPLLVPLWYIRSLLIFVVLSHLIVKSRKTVVVVYIVALVCSVAILPGRISEFANKFFSVSGLFYFCCGFSLSLLRVNLPRLSRRVAIFLLFGGFFVIALKSYIAFATGWYCDRWLRLLFVPPILVGPWEVLPAVRLPTWVSSLSFPIYLLHVPVMFVGGLFFTWHTETILGWLAKYVFVLAGSALICWVMKRFSPRIASVAFGGRI